MSVESVPFVRLDQADPELMSELLETVARVAHEGAFTLGDEVASFESEFAAFCDAEHAVGISSGTTAIELALRALGIGPGDEVIVPTNSFIATAEAVSALGARPVLVDVDETTSLIDADIVEGALTPKTRCVIPVHLYGRTVAMDPLLELCRAKGIRVVEDACQAHGARYGGKPVGALGDAGCFSFYPTKNLGGWGDGGAVVTDDAELARKLTVLRSHGEDTRHHHEVATGTHRLDGLQAGLLSVKLGRLAEWNQARRHAARALTEALASSEVAPPAPANAEGDHVFHLFVVRTESRDELRSAVGKSGVATAIHYPTPIHLQPAYASLGYAPGDLPVAERLAGQICSLPMFPSIQSDEIEFIASAVEAARPATV